MVFSSPSWIPELPIDPPDSVSIEEFMYNEAYGRCSITDSRNPFTCGLTGHTYTAADVKARINFLARSISKRLGFAPNQDSEWDKVVGLYALNTINYIPVAHAIHRLSGIVTPISAACSVSELEHQLRSSDCKALFTCLPLLQTALRAATAVGIPPEQIFLLEVPGAEEKTPFATVEELIQEGRTLIDLNPLKWTHGQGARQVAFLCFSSGTSGLPKAVMISHRNVISTILQISTFQSVARKRLGLQTEVTLGLLPFNHIYGLVVVAHCNTYQGHEVIVLPRFDLKSFLAAVARFKIEQLALVPPILLQLLQNQGTASQYDLSSIRILYTGAAPLGPETVAETLKIYPTWHITQGYGLTEAPVVSFTDALDIDVGSSGSLVPGMRCKIMAVDGKEITDYGKRGELLIQGPSVMLGYLNNDKANADSFVWDNNGRWLKTGDEVMMRQAASGNDHLVIVDRIKELIKVKGHQVAPAELETHLLTHPAVSDCAVLPVQDAYAGEVPKAYVVKAKEAERRPETDVIRDIVRHVEEHKAKHKWLKGGIKFVDIIPKSPSGKILRRLLRDQERESTRKNGVKL